MYTFGYSILILLSLLVGCFQGASKAIQVEFLSYPKELEVTKREQWGWQPLSTSLPVHEITKITIHHGGEDFPEDKAPVDYLRNLQSWSRAEKKWIDIPYHFMIDLEGTIYEARPINYPGDTNTSYDPTGHALICVMGNYEHQIMSESQLSSLIDLTAFLTQQFRVSVNDIKGHKDYTETLCPGKDLYRYLQDGSLRTRLLEALGN